MGQSIIVRSFASGELAPVLHARADQVRYASGLRTCRNFLVRREGGVSNRAGFRFVGAAKTDTAGTRLMRYVGATAGVGYLIEMGQGYFRFFQDGATLRVSSVPAYNAGTAYVPGDLVVSAAVNYYCHSATTGHAPPDLSYWHALTADAYEIPTSYSLGALPDWNQSGNVITLTHPTQPPRELVCVSPTRWILRNVTTTPTLAAPSGLGGSAGAAGTRTFRYQVTAAAADTYEESNPSGAYSIVNCAEPTADAPNDITWASGAGRAECYVYCDPYGNGVFGYIGTAIGADAFKDTGLVPDFNSTPPVARSLFGSSSTYPSHSTNYQQRRLFANSVNEPDGVWGSRIGFPSNWGISSPLQDDDAITFRLAGNNNHPIRHLVALKAGLVLLTDGGEWTVTGGNGAGSPLTPSGLNAEQETYAGASADVRPAVVGNAILYVQARGSIVRDLRFEQQVQGLAGQDLTIWATHLFGERQTAVALDYQQVPHSIVWCVRSDGTLLGLTYVPDQDIWGWHRHDTDGTFEDCCVVPEADEDALYVLVARTIGGVTKRYIERLERRDIREAYPDHDSFFVDSGLSYSSTYAAKTFSGLGHLEGKVVAVLADGVVVFNGDPTAAAAATYTVTGGAITLATAAINVHIGLPIRYGEIELLDLDVQGSAVRDKQKRIASVTLLIERSSRGFWAGPDSTHLRRYDPQAWEGTADLNTGQYSLTLTSQFDKYGRVFIRHVDPLPLTILGVIPNVDLGGA